MAATSLIDRSVKVTKRGSAIVTCLVTVEGDTGLSESNDDASEKNAKKVGVVCVSGPNPAATEII